jgi:hypothetical protein
MAECPECGTEVDQTAKWIMEGKTDSNEERARLEIGMFICSPASTFLVMFEKSTSFLGNYHS